MSANQFSEQDIEGAKSEEIQKEQFIYLNNLNNSLESPSPLQCYCSESPKFDKVERKQKKDVLFFDDSMEKF